MAWDLFTYQDDPLADGYGPGVRQTDPATSHDAVVSITAHLPAQRTSVLVEVGRAGSWGLTAADVAVALGKQQSVMSKRLSELAGVGLVDVAPFTRPGISGRQLTVYMLSDYGRQVLTTIEEADK